MPRTFLGYELDAPFERALDHCVRGGNAVVLVRGERGCSGTMALPFAVSTITFGECRGLPSTVLCMVRVTFALVPLEQAEHIVEHARGTFAAQGSPRFEHHVDPLAPRRIRTPAERRSIARCTQLGREGSLACVATGEMHGISYRWPTLSGRIELYVWNLFTDPARLAVSIVVETDRHVFHDVATIRD